MRLIDPKEVHRKIFTRGLAGRRSQLPFRYKELVAESQKRLSAEAFAYIEGGAGRESSVDRNVKAFDRWGIIPNMLRGEQKIDIGVQLMGRKLKSPFLLSPIGVLSMAHPRADLAVSRAAAQLEVPYIFSNQASASMEDCAREMRNAPRWFQLYFSQSDALVKSLLKRAESVGCEAIVVTLDTTRLGWRPRDLKLGYLPFLYGRGIAQYTSDPVFQQLIDEKAYEREDEDPRPPINLHSLSALWSQKKHYPGGWKKWFSSRPTQAVRLFIKIFSRTSLDWEDIRKLRDWTDLPIILKGIMNPADAEQAQKEGLNGIIVSNHGGRQVDGSISSIEMLPRIVERVGYDYPVIFDSGIRSGAHAMKALCLGAKAVCIGRPYVHALALGGAEGVSQLLLHNIAELQLNMALSGVHHVEDLNRDLLEGSI